jgi:hypothetical protein
MVSLTSWLVRVGAVMLFVAVAAARAQSVDVVIYGATPGGIAAALAAAKSGHSVLLVEPSIRIGGMTTNGLSHPDFRAFEAITGTYLDLTRRTTAYYTQHYGADSQQVKDTFRGTHAEPKVNLLLFQQMLAAYPKITVKTEWILTNAYTRGPAGNRWVRAAQFRDKDGKEHVYDGKIFIDGSYEGDLIAAAQVPYRIGVESRDEYSEAAAPEDGSGDLQGYNFRFVMTDDPAIRVPVKAPKGYRREDFTPMLELISSGKLKRAFGGYRDTDNIVKAQIPILPNNKRDINDVSRGYVRLSLPGDQLLWPEGDAAIRQQIYDEHVRWNVGLIYFAQNDPAVPAAFREEAKKWGWCRDEFVESDHIPPQLYVREARRMVGLRIFTQNDTRHAEGDARAVLHRDAIAIGDYGHSSHGTRHEGSRFGGKRFGEGLGVVYAPYQIPYGTIVAKEVRNLLAPVPVSASHVGFCALRLEPIWTSLGQAAGHAAHLALQQGNTPDVRTVAIAPLQRRLHADNAATIYIADVLPGTVDFAAVQWWGSVGGLHGLASRPAVLLGKQIEGQHSESWLNHTADLQRALDPALARRWLDLAKGAGVSIDSLPKADGRVTRGDWIRAVFAVTK